jgi:hypothetical protein
VLALILLIFGYGKNRINYRRRIYFGFFCTQQNPLFGTHGIGNISVIDTFSCPAHGRLSARLISWQSERIFIEWKENNDLGARTISTLNIGPLAARSLMGLGFLSLRQALS